MGLRSWWAQLNSSVAELDAQELRVDAERAGAAAIEAVNSGQVRTLKGTIQSLVYRPEVSVPMLEAELFDGSGRITLVWMGRRKIRGINPGTKMAVTGRLVRSNGRLTMFNPNYAVLPNGNGG
jgi:RecG-like helicase